MDKSNQTFDWGAVYRRHKAKGMDHADAAFRADEAEARWKRKEERRTRQAIFLAGQRSRSAN